MSTVRATCTSSQRSLRYVPHCGSHAHPELGGHPVSSAQPWSMEVFPATKPVTVYRKHLPAHRPTNCGAHKPTSKITRLPRHAASMYFSTPTACATPAPPITARTPYPHAFRTSEQAATGWAHRGLKQCRKTLQPSTPPGRRLSVHILQNGNANHRSKQPHPQPCHRRAGCLPGALFQAITCHIPLPAGSTNSGDCQLG
ncbi:hypothetical protein CCHOA_10220 [Corynebacterium choanae]|uniref:Uncharacterized protein n=1 Tax=Corynebacterium choanae TaxID=1862358 RepID=A0A3G6J8N6_9CORY|nr:hypothetical protein CCHOA_10220 [Corynebacterium choanae]